MISFTRVKTELLPGHYMEKIGLKVGLTNYLIETKDDLEFLYIFGNFENVNEIPAEALLTYPDPKIRSLAKTYIDEGPDAVQQILFEYVTEEIMRLVKAHVEASDAKKDL